MTEPHWLVVAAGSNIDPARNLPAALRRLHERLEVVRVSAVYETPPVGAPGTPDFWNAAILVRSDLTPARVKHEILRPIEAELGRTRGDDPNAPRTIDLDLVLWSGGPVEDPQTALLLPDPSLTEQAHLAIPVSEVASDWVDPASGRTLSQLASRFSGRAAKVELDGWAAASR